MRKNGHKKIKHWLEADDSDVYVMKESDNFFVSPEKDSNKENTWFFLSLNLLFLFPKITIYN